MKVEWVNSSEGYPGGGFVISADSDQDQYILRAFLTVKHEYPDDWKFHIHNFGGKSGDKGIRSFFFGYAKIKKSD